MYNESQKRAFIEACNTKQSKSFVTNSERVFALTEPIELACGADISTRPVDDLQEFVDHASRSAANRRVQIAILKKYLAWCVETGKEGAIDESDKLDLSGVTRMRGELVYGPSHLQRCLDECFAPEDELTIDNTYRAYCWLAFMGVKEADVPFIKKSDIDLSNLSLHYNRKLIGIYRESIAVFRNLVESDSFVYEHPHYKTIRERVDSDNIMRGVKSECSIATIRGVIKKRSDKAIELGKSTTRLRYGRLYYSGLFYRKMDEELSIGEADFHDAARESVLDAGNRSTPENNDSVNAQANRLKEEYLIWKAVFYR